MQSIFRLLILVIIALILTIYMTADAQTTTANPNL